MVCHDELWFAHLVTELDAEGRMGVVDDVGLRRLAGREFLSGVGCRRRRSAGECWDRLAGAGIVLLPTVVHTDPGFGPLAMAAAKVVGFGGVLWIEIGCEARRPVWSAGAHGGGSIDCVERKYSARRAMRANSLAFTIASSPPAARISSSVGARPIL